MYKLDQPAAPQDSGLHLLRPSAGGYTAQRVWAGDARSCCIWDQPPGGQERATTAAANAGGGGSGEVGLAVGTEPADVFVSLDGGSAWSAGTSSFEGAPSRPSWSFPAPPHQPHVLSLERTASGQLVAGIEVGGVQVGGGPSFDRFEERNEGLYADVHSCRIDPHNPRHWLAVTGAAGWGGVCCCLGGKVKGCHRRFLLGWQGTIHNGHHARLRHVTHPNAWTCVPCRPWAVCFRRRGQQLARAGQLEGALHHRAGLQPSAQGKRQQRASRLRMGRH